MEAIQEIFIKKNGYATLADLKQEHIPYACIMHYLKLGRISRVHRGVYHWQSEQDFNEIAAITALFPDGILCMDSALFFYGYTDRTPGEWHIAVDKDSSKMRFNIEYPFVKPYFLEPSILAIGVSKQIINGISAQIYDRERVICDCLRYSNKIDRELFNKAIQAYITDPHKNIGRLTTYAKQLRIYKKVQTMIGVWL